METFSVLLAICAGNSLHWSPVNSPHKGQWRGALKFSLICVWIKGLVNNREAGDLRFYRAHYDVIVMEERMLRHTRHSTMQLDTVNSLGPSDAIWRHRSGSTLAQVMACCLTAPSHYLNQCWLIISKVLWHSFDGNFIKRYLSHHSLNLAWKLPS